MQDELKSDGNIKNSTIVLEHLFCQSICYMTEGLSGLHWDSSHLEDLFALSSKIRMMLMHNCKIISCTFWQSVHSFAN